MERKQLPEDFKDFIHCLNSNKVKYLLVGGWAVGLYGHPRATKDIDFLIFTDNKNLKKLGKALADFGAPPVDINYLRERSHLLRERSQLMREGSQLPREGSQLPRERPQLPRERSQLSRERSRLSRERPHRFRGRPEMLRKPPKIVFTQ